MIQFVLCVCTARHYFVYLAIQFCSMIDKIKKTKYIKLTVAMETVICGLHIHAVCDQQCI